VWSLAGGLQDRAYRVAKPLLGRVEYRELVERNPQSLTLLHPPKVTGLPSLEVGEVLLHADAGSAVGIFLHFHRVYGAVTPSMVRLLHP
jgi:hypothetical protein